MAVKSYLYLGQTREPSRNDAKEMSAPGTTPETTNPKTKTKKGKGGGKGNGNGGKHLQLPPAQIPWDVPETPEHFKFRGVPGVRFPRSGPRDACIVPMHADFDRDACDCAIANLMYAASDPGMKNIILCLQSYGGEVLGLRTLVATLDEIRQRPNPPTIWTYVDGGAYSCGGITALLGDYVIMGDGSFIMLHDLRSFLSSEKTQRIMQECFMAMQLMTTSMYSAADRWTEERNTRIRKQIEKTHQTTRRGGRKTDPAPDPAHAPAPAAPPTSSEGESEAAGHAVVPGILDPDSDGLAKKDTVNTFKFTHMVPKHFIQEGTDYTGQLWIPAYAHKDGHETSNFAIKIRNALGVVSAADCESGWQKNIYKRFHMIYTKILQTGSYDPIQRRTPLHASTSLVLSATQLKNRARREKIKAKKIEAREAARADSAPAPSSEDKQRFQSLVGSW